ncbi:hypothetical protein [Christiangramia forsetii]|uniref:Secreted protein n=2 Tax=Christiangramia forsetii TaxID=411153 RepID=A0M4N0_CHRFK|nr:hypothetical protein [Christiangramia forsetii]GGG23049.1 hypothetical protein GCM10011532_02700 [Christiangramia forsetii]CAL67575.1 secreted protein [Christiangramia forsetii KT0803]
MKKISLLLLLLISNLSIISCTEQSLGEATDEPQRQYASEGEEDPNPPSEEPPSNGN